MSSWRRAFECDGPNLSPPEICPLAGVGNLFLRARHRHFEKDRFGFLGKRHLELQTARLTTIEFSQKPHQSPSCVQILGHSIASARGRPRVVRRSGHLRCSSYVDPFLQRLCWPHWLSSQCCKVQGLTARRRRGSTGAACARPQWLP